MKIGAYLKKRSQYWAQLENLNNRLQSVGAKSLTGEDAANLAKHYRNTCSDLAMANENKLPSQTVRYLHNLVARAHNLFYGSTAWVLGGFLHNVFVYAPRRVLNDPCVQVASLLFFGLFSIAAVCASNEELFPNFAERVLGTEQIEQFEEMYSHSIQDSRIDQSHYVFMSAFYIQHNTSIGLRCFGSGILILPCIYELLQNAAVLGSTFGYMARDSAMGGENFFQFVTAHGPFELTAIVLAAAAGLRVGIGLFVTHGLARISSVRKAANDAIPIIFSSVTLFILAAFTEACISPTGLPYIFKALWAIFSSICMMIYFVVLGSQESEEFHAA